MRKILYFFLFIFVTACISKKKTTYSKTRKVSVVAKKSDRDIEDVSNTKKTVRTKRNKADAIIRSALKYSGVRYKYGGTTRRGMDCSGLLYVAFGENNVKLPRTSYHMAEEGKKVRIKEINKGDLLFFKTNKRSKRINHVGMVVSTKNNEIKFVHASSSRGVIVSSLREGYWHSAFIKATRVL